MKTLRERLIEAGLIIPSAEVYLPGQKPFLSQLSVLKLRANLIRRGILIPVDWRGH